MLMLICRLCCRDMRSVVFSPNNELLAAGGRDGNVEIWNVEDGVSKATLPLHRQRIRQLAITDNNQLVSCGDDRLIRITDLNNTNDVRTLPEHNGKLFSLCVLRNGLLATGGSDNTIYVWSLDDFVQVGALIGHNGSITSLDFQDNILVSGSYDTQVRIWATEKTALLDDLNTFQR